MLSSDSEDYPSWGSHAQQQQQYWPPELLQPPPAGPLLVNVTSMLSWTDGSPPGLERWAARQLPPDLDQQQLLWVSVYQPGGPGSTAAIWVGKAPIRTSDSDGFDSDRGSDHGDDHETLDSGMSDQAQSAAGDAAGIVLSADMIRTEQNLALLLQQHYQKQQQPRRRRRPKSLAALLQQLGPLWLEVQQRPVLGSAPAAVVEGLTFVRHSNSAYGSGSSSSSSSVGSRDGSSDECMHGDLSHQQQQQQQDEVLSADPAVAPAEAAQDGSWYDYLLLVAGEFSTIEHENMFPNLVVHCSDGRVMHDARDAADVASFVAQAVESDVRSHMINLIRIAWDKHEDSRYGPDWILHRLQQRWGQAALDEFGVNMDYLNARVLESGVLRMRKARGAHVGVAAAR